MAKVHLKWSLTEKFSIKYVDTKWAMLQTTIVQNKQWQKICVYW